MEKITIILVHGAWSDGAHWKYVISKLVKAGYKVRAAQNPLTSLTDDVQKTTDLINLQEGKVLLVGYSYGGAVITNAGNNDKVAGLVYVAAYAPDKGESVGEISGKRQVSGSAGIAGDDKGFLWYNYDEYQKGICADVKDEDALVMSLTQKSVNGQCFGEQTYEAAWKTKPTWYQISTQDNMLHPDTQKEMAERINAKKTISLDSSHASLVSHPEEVSELIIEAAKSLN